MTCHRLSALLALATNVRMKRDSLPGAITSSPPITANPNDTDSSGNCQLNGPDRHSVSLLSHSTGPRAVRSRDEPAQKTDKQTRQQVSEHARVTKPGTAFT